MKITETVKAALHEKVRTGAFMPNVEEALIALAKAVEELQAKAGLLPAKALTGVTTGSGGSGAYPDTPANPAAKK